MSISTVIIAPSVLLREGIAALLQGSCYKVVASAARPSELSAACCPKGQPTLIITGLDLQNCNLDHAAAGISLLRSLMPDAKIVLVAEADKPIDLERMPIPSLHACILSLRSRNTLIKVLELAFMDQRVFVFAKSVATAAKQDADVMNSARISRPGISYEFSDSPSLSPRESEVLTSLAEGKSNKSIARVCHISEATVKVHLKAILRKTKAHNRTQAAIWAIQHGFRNSSNNGAESNGFSVAESPSLAPVSQAATIQSPRPPQSHADVAPSEPHSSTRNASKAR
jgi:two-component system, NarL family, nitrate/nitrite response regulator NarL